MKTLTLSTNDLICITSQVYPNFNPFKIEVSKEIQDIINISLNNIKISNTLIVTKNQLRNSLEKELIKNGIIIL